MNEAQPGRHHADYNIPLPDPSFLTTEQLLRSITAVREVLEAQMKGESAASAQFQMHIAARLDEAKEKVTQLRELHEVRFESIETQFRERDTRTEQMSIATKTAVDAALMAAEKAVGKQNESSAIAINKSETTTMDQLKQIMELFRTSNTAMDDKISDLKDRVTAAEGRSSGLDHAAHGTRDNWSSIISGVLALVAIIGVVASFLRPTGH